MEIYNHVPHPNDIPFCDICQQTKVKKATGRAKPNEPRKPCAEYCSLEVVHLDLKGQFLTHTFGGNRYIIAIEDHIPRYSWGEIRQ